MHFIAVIVLASLVQQTTEIESNKKSTFATDRQVEFPGIVLEAGVYTIRLRTGDEKRSLVQILNQDETQLLASVMAVPDHRTRPEDNGEFTFHSVKSEGPQPVQSWFYSGDPMGLEFVYPKERAKDIAKETNDHVMASNRFVDDVILAVTPSGREIVVDDRIAQTNRHKPR